MTEQPDINKTKGNILFRSGKGLSRLTAALSEDSPKNKLIKSLSVFLAVLLACQSAYFGVLGVNLIDVNESSEQSSLTAEYTEAHSFYSGSHNTSLGRAGDFSFDGLWSNKAGSDMPEIFTKQPSDTYWSLGANKKFYNSNTVYMAVKIS